MTDLYDMDRPRTPPAKYDTYEKLFKKVLDLLKGCNITWKRPINHFGQFYVAIEVYEGRIGCYLPASDWDSMSFVPDVTAVTTPPPVRMNPFTDMTPYMEPIAYESEG